MKKRIFCLPLLFSFISCLSIPDPMESVVPQDTTVENKIYAAMKFSSNIDLEAFFDQFELIPQAVVEAKGYKGMASELIKLSSKDTGIYQEFVYTSWAEYTIVQLPPGKYRLNSSKYPPSLESRGIAFQFEREIIFELEKDAPFIYLGDIELNFIEENEFGQSDTWLRISDNYDASLEQLDQWLLDKEGEYILPVNKTQPTGRIPFTMKNI